LRPTGPPKTCGLVSPNHSSKWLPRSPGP
jgi:hypothetical protein